MEPLLEELQQEREFIGTFSLAFLWLLYVIYAVSGAVILVPALTLPAAVAILFAFLLVRIEKRRKHPILSTHYRWLYRTFWIGMGVYLTIITLAMAAIAAPALDVTPFENAIMNGTMMTPEEINTTLLAQQPASSKYMMIALGGVFALWWLWRCGVGMAALYRQQAVAKPDSWL